VKSAEGDRIAPGPFRPRGVGTPGSWRVSASIEFQGGVPEVGAVRARVVHRDAVSVRPPGSRRRSSRASKMFAPARPCRRSLVAFAGDQPCRFGSGQRRLSRTALGRVGAVQSSAGDAQPGEVGATHRRARSCRRAASASRPACDRDQRPVEVRPGQVAFVQQRAARSPRRRSRGGRIRSCGVPNGCRLIDGDVGATVRVPFRESRPCWLAVRTTRLPGRIASSSPRRDVELELLRRVGGDLVVGGGGQQRRPMAVLADRDEAPGRTTECSPACRRPGVPAICARRRRAAVAVQRRVDGHDGRRADAPGRLDQRAGLLPGEPRAIQRRAGLPGFGTGVDSA